MILTDQVGPLAEVVIGTRPWSAAAEILALRDTGLDTSGGTYSSQSAP